MVPGFWTAADYGRRPPPFNRTDLPRRDWLQGHQGPRGASGGAIVALARATGIARQTRPGEALPAQRAHAESFLRSEQSTAHRNAHSGIIRRDADTKNRNGPRAGAGAHPDARHET